MRSQLKIVLLLCLAQCAAAQSLFKGFIPDENGTNPEVLAQQWVTPGAIVKDCAECPEMVVIPVGSFVMGSTKNADEKPPHAVTVRRFLMGKTEITQKQWSDIMGSNPSQFAGCGQNCPVERVSWVDAQQFIARLNKKTGQKYRLPSEAEWEYAARAGSTTEWSFGDEGFKLRDYAVYRGNSAGYTTRVVGQKLPNAFGLFDMYGNVWEWTDDCWHENYRDAPSNGSAWKTVCDGFHRVLRGGSWYYNYPESFRSAVRLKYIPDSWSNDIGFRLARDL